jgi:hypothetical protein
VQISVSRSDGGLESRALARLAPLPDAAHAGLIEIGVLQGGRRVLFARLADTTLVGPARCIPGPVDCELVSLAPGQRETVSVHPANSGPVSTDFAVTGIDVRDLGSRGQADRARAQVDAAGEHRLSQAVLPALGLFEYRAALDAVVDLRNLFVGDN